MKTFRFILISISWKKIYQKEINNFHESYYLQEQVIDSEDYNEFHDFSDYNLKIMIAI